MPDNAGWAVLAGIVLAAMSSGLVNARLLSVEPAGWRYLWGGVCALSGLGAGFVAFMLALPPAVCLLLAMATGFAAGAALLDIFTGHIADIQSGVILICGLATSVFLYLPGQEIWVSFLFAASGGALAAGILGGVAWLYRAGKGEPGLGEGDIILAGAAASWAGLPFTGLGLLLASVGTILCAVLLRRTHARLPFGPGIVIGFSVVFVMHVKDWLTYAS